MNRQQVKELLPILQAFAEGKEIQVKSGNGIWYDGGNELKFDLYPQNYCILEQKYRPFKDSEECWNEMQKHQPFGWTKLKGEIGYSFIMDVDDNTDYSDAFRGCTFADGTPFGIPIEDK